MKKQERIPNRYDSLRIDCLEDAVPVSPQSFWTITDSRSETITITTALLPDGSYVYGYIVYWAKGTTSTKSPSTANGKFRNKRDAQLHAVGFFMIYLEHFLPETRSSIIKAQSHLSQAEFNF